MSESDSHASVGIPAWRVALLGALCSVGFVIYYASRWPSPVLPVDDAYITLHNALALFGDSDAYQSSAVEGSTSLLHLLLVGVTALVVPPEWAPLLVGWIATACYAAGLARLAASLGCSTPWAVGIALLSLVVGRAVHQLNNGLETAVALAGIAWSLELAVGEGRRYWMGPALWATLPFIRPELSALTGLLLARRCWNHFRQGRREWYLRDLAIAGAFAAPWLVFTFASTGGFVPATAGAKRAFFAEGCLPAAIKLAWVETAVRDFGRSVGIASFGLLLLAANRRLAICLVFPAVLVLAYYLEFPGALGHYENRYLYVLVPLMLAGVSAWVGSDRMLPRWTGCAVLLVGLIQSFLALPMRYREHDDRRRFTETELFSLRDFIENATPPGSSLLVHDAGAIGRVADRTLYDLVGLKTPESRDVHEMLTLPSCGRRRGEAIGRLLERYQPDYLVLLKQWDRIFGISGSLSRLGWKLVPVREMSREYLVFSIQGPDQSPPTSFRN